MTLVRVYGNLKYPQSDIPWANAQIVFTLDRGSFTNTTQYLSDRVVVETNSSGNFEVNLWANAEGLIPSAWKCQYPDGDSFTFVLSASNLNVNISSLRTSSEWEPPAGMYVLEGDPRLTNARPASSASDEAIGDRTADPTQVPTGNVGKLTQWISRFANRIAAITGKNWYDAPDITLASTKTRLDELDTAVASKLTVTGTPSSGQVPKFNGSAVVWSADESGSGSGSSDWNDITGKPTTLSGYGITDAVSSSDSRLSDARSPLAGSVSLTSLVSGFTLPWSQIGSTPTTIAGYGIADAVNTSDSRLNDQRIPTDASVTTAKLAPGLSVPWANVNKSGSSPADVGAEAAGTAASLITNHTNVIANPNPHPQYAINLETSPQTVTAGGLDTDRRWLHIAFDITIPRNFSFLLSRLNTDGLGSLASRIDVGTAGTSGGYIAATQTWVAAAFIMDAVQLATSSTLSDRGVYIRVLGGRPYTVSGLPPGCTVSDRGASQPGGLTTIANSPSSQATGILQVSSFQAANVQGTLSVLFGAIQSTSTTTGTLRLSGANAGIGLTGNINAGGYGAFGAGLGITATGARITDILTATLVISSPSSTQTMTVTGAQVGDHVLLSRGVGGFVSVANTVQFDSTGLSGVTVRATVLRVS